MRVLREPFFFVPTVLFWPVHDEAEPNGLCNPVKYWLIILRKNQSKNSRS